MLKNYRLLQFLESVFIVASVVSGGAAVMGYPVNYAVALVSIALLLNWFNRQELTRYTKTNITATLAQLNQHKAAVEQMSQQLKIAIISLDVANSQLEQNNGKGESGMDLKSIVFTLQQVASRQTLLEQTINLMQSEIEIINNQFKQRPELAQIESLTHIIIDLQQFINQLPQWGSLHQQQLVELQQKVDSAVAQLSAGLAEIPKQVEVAVKKRVNQMNKERGTGNREPGIGSRE